MHRIFSYVRLFVLSCVRSVFSAGGLVLCSIRQAANRKNGAAAPRRICILQTAGTGDAVLTLPVITALRSRFPDANISIAARSAGFEVFSAFIKDPHVEIVPYTSCTPSLSSFDAILYVRGSPLLLRESFRNRRAAFFHALPLNNPLRSAPFRLLGFPAIGKSEHQYKALRRMLAGLDVLLPERFEGPHPCGSEPLNIELPSGRFAVVHPGSGWEPRRWPSARFKELIEHLYTDFGLSTVLIGGNEEKELTARLAAGSPAILDAAGLLSLPELMNVLRRSVLFIGNDSGPSHLAALAGTPSLVLYGPQDPALFGVLGKKAVIVAGTPFCSPCWQVVCPFAGTRRHCMSQIPVEKALSSVPALLGKAL